MVSLRCKINCCKGRRRVIAGERQTERERESERERFLDLSLVKVKVVGWWSLFLCGCVALSVCKVCVVGGSFFPSIRERERERERETHTKTTIR